MILTNMVICQNTDDEVIRASKYIHLKQSRVVDSIDVSIKIFYRNGYKPKLIKVKVFPQIKCHDYMIIEY